jgi:hypothetical protein
VTATETLAAALGPHEVARLQAFLAAGELPLGWVCKRAGGAA